MAADGMVKHVVLDSGAFLRNAPVQSIGENVYTIPEVVEEIKDKATKQRLQVLPYQLIYREPAPDSIKTVTDFAKKTGDYGSLSAVDVRVMALTLQLEKENVGMDHIKTAPEKKVEWNCRSRNLEKPTDIAGFYIKSKKSSSRTTSECSTRSETDSLATELDERLGPVNEEQSSEPGPVRSEDYRLVGNLQETKTNDSTEEHKEINNDKSIACESHTVIDINNKPDVSNHNQEADIKTSCNLSDKQSSFPSNTGELQEGEVITTEFLEEDTDESSDNDSDNEEDDDDEGWITPSNIKTVKEKMGMGDLEKSTVPVGCLTTDFAMQNVLIQMGLNVISVDGMLIKRAKSYVLRCFACMRITTNVQKEFCPHCGNKTLTRVSMTVNDDGSIRYFLSKRPISKKGTNVPLPMPKGGKHHNNPYLTEDQPYPQQRAAKKAQGKMDVFNPDYIAGQSPFMMNDVTSRASQLGIKARKGQTGWDRRNQNAGRKKRK